MVRRVIGVLVMPDQIIVLHSRPGHPDVVAVGVNIMLDEGDRISQQAADPFLDAPRKHNFADDAPPRIGEVFNKDRHIKGTGGVTQRVIAAIGVHVRLRQCGA